MKVELHSEKPEEPLRPTILELTKDAINVDIAVAFVTEFGVDAIRQIIGQLNGKASVRVLVSLLFPTDLEAVANLSDDIEVFIHRGRTKTAEKLHWQFHSKIVLIERPGQSCAIIVGSHNWTKNGLNGGNLEASLIVECSEADPLVAQVKKHIDECRQVSEKFDRANMLIYQALQREFHPQVDSHSLPSFSELERFDGIVLLAESSVEQFDLSRRIFFHIPISDSRLFQYQTRVLIYLYPNGTLFGKNYPLPKPVLLQGAIGTNDDDPARPSEINAYFIRDIQRPIVEHVKQLPLLAPNEMLIAAEIAGRPSRQFLPLFHTGNTIKPKVKLDSMQQNVKFAKKAVLFSRTGIEDDHLSSSDVPIEVHAELNLKIPFREIAYPQALRTLLDSFAIRATDRSQELPLKFNFEEPRMITNYVCSVRYRSNLELTNAISKNLE